MEALHDRCAGLDVHKQTVVACALWLDSQGHRHHQVQSFGTFTIQLQALGRWLAEKGVTHVAMESTGVYWKPVFNILEADFEVVPVNARHIKQVPGRKSDVLDCQWIAQLLQHGLLKASYIPPPAQRQLRDLCRQRAQLTGEHTRIANRIQKVLEDANIKLSSVASNVLGVSGRAMLGAIVAGQQDPKALADLARTQLRNKIPQLELALSGSVNEHHRYLLEMLLSHLGQLEALIGQLDRRIQRQCRPWAKALQRLQQIPGIQQRVAEDLLAEIGPDMSVFPDHTHLASWAGLAPGQRQSGPRQGSGKPPPGNRWLRRCLTQAAWAASHTRNTYLSARYHRLAGRRGPKRAVMAVAHTMLVSAYHMLQEGTDYQELGANYFDQLHPQRLAHHLVHRLEHMGYNVTLQPQETQAM